MAGIGLRPHTSKNSATEVGICPMPCSPDFGRYIISHNKTPPHMLYHWKASEHYLLIDNVVEARIDTKLVKMGFKVNFAEKQSRKKPVGVTDFLTKRMWNMSSHHIN
eukprot:scaffold665_cov279-Ochromonas_danica.AAC.3